MTTDQPQNEPTYFIDAENAAEMARLMNQDRIITENMGGLFPEQPNLSSVSDILDIGCGPGGWVLDVAYTYPTWHVVGFDVSRLMIEYARAQAKVQKLNNASFKVMDALKPLDFPNNSFDLVNARFISGFMPPASWPILMQECWRILRPAGILRLTEPEFPISNSLASEKLYGMIARALQAVRQSFSPDGRHVGITPMLTRFLRNAGFQNIRKTAHALDSSAGTEEFTSQYQNTMVFLKLLQPFVVKTGISIQQEVEGLYQQALAEMMSDSYCVVWYYLTVSGEKP
jgi:SAM-dependent methyltransferase